MSLPQVCTSCRKLKPAELGRFIPVRHRCHDRVWRCHHCESKREQKFAQGRARELSPLERQVAAALAETEFTFKTEFPLGSFFVDFAVPALGLLIEVDSQRWHSHPSRLRRDRLKDKLASQAGLKLVRVRAPDLKAKVSAAVACREAEIARVD